jgi:hypothetical protein
LEIREILLQLKELTLELAAGKRRRSETVQELYKRIDPEVIFNLPADEAQRDFITQVFVSLENLTTEEFATSPAEINYYAEVFSGQRQFILAEVRQFEIGSFEKEGERQPAKKAKAGEVKSRSRKNSKPQ